MATLTLSDGPDMQRIWRRFLIACVASLALHLVLLIGVRINPTGGVPDVVSMSQVMTARLEPLPAEEIAPPLEALTEAEVLPDSVPSIAPPLTPQPPAPKPVPTPSTGLDVPLVRDPTYYPAKQLDVYPEPTTLIKPQYPEAALAARANGSVLLLLLIDEFGMVNEASVAKADPPGYFEEVTVQAFRTAQFIPAQRQGRKVKSRVLIKVNFDYDAEQRDRQ
jgi:protein TonB